MSGEKRVRTASKSQETNVSNLDVVENDISAVTATATEPQAEDSGLLDVFPDFAVNPEEVTRRTEMLKSYVREHMKEGEDYGIVPGGNKPTLFKPGAEKLNAVYGLSPLVEVANRVEDWDAGFVAYEVKVILLNKRTDKVEAEGIGSCNSRERRYKNQDAANISNTVLKMAKKRALIDATLSATRASGMFTQDLEDLDLEAERPRYAPRPTQNQSAPREAAPQQRETPQVSPANAGDAMTEKQHHAILAIAGRVFGRHSRDEDLLRMAQKPLEELSRSEASNVIEQLKDMLGDGAPAPQAQSGEREMAFSRPNRNGTAR